MQSTTSKITPSLTAKNTKVSLAKGEFFNTQKGKEEEETKGCNSCGSSGCVKDNCVYYGKWSWPTVPRETTLPCSFSAETISAIPTGSLIFIADSGPLSTIRVYVSGCPYNKIGIITQLEERGTFVCCVDYYLGEGNKVWSETKLVPLISILQDPSVSTVSVLLLKDFNTSSSCDSFLSNPILDKDERIGNVFPAGNGFIGANAIANAFAEGQYLDDSDDFALHKGPNSKQKCKKEPKQPAKCISVSSVSSSSCCSSSSCSSSVMSCDSSDHCAFSAFSSSIDSRSDWCKALEKFKLKVFSSILSNYFPYSGECDTYQLLAPIFGLPVAEEYRTKTAFTQEEFVGLILYQSGFINNASFSSNGMDIMCNENFWSELSRKVASSCSPVEAVVQLNVPSGPCFDEVCKYAVDSDRPSLELRVAESMRQARKNSIYFGEKCPSEKYRCGHTEQVQGCNNCSLNNFSLHKGSCKENIGKWKQKKCSSSSSSSSCNSDSFPKPRYDKRFFTPLFFGSLSVVDFLTGYYQSHGIDPKGSNNFCDLKEAMKEYCVYGLGSDYIDLIEDLAAKRAAGSKWKSTLNILDMSWYTDDLVNIQKCNLENVSCTSMNCTEKWRYECCIWKEIVCSIKTTFQQKQLLHQDKIGMSGNILLQLAKRLTFYQSVIHEIACEASAEIEWRESRWKCKDFASECKEKESSYIPILCGCKQDEGKYPLFCQSYMQGCCWRFCEDAEAFCEEDNFLEKLNKFEKLKPFICVLDDVIEGLLASFRITPLNSILREMFWYTRCNAIRLRCWIKKSEKHCNHYYKKQKNRLIKQQRKQRQLEKKIKRYPSYKEVTTVKEEESLLDFDSPEQYTVIPENKKVVFEEKQESSSFVPPQNMIKESFDEEGSSTLQKYIGNGVDQMSSDGWGRED